MATVAVVQTPTLRQRISTGWAAFVKKHIVDDFDAHFPGEPWLFDYEVVIENGKKVFREF